MALFVLLQLVLLLISVSYVVVWQFSEVDFGRFEIFQGQGPQRDPKIETKIEIKPVNGLCTILLITYVGRLYFSCRSTIYLQQRALHMHADVTIPQDQPRTINMMETPFITDVVQVQALAFHYK